MGVEGCCLKEEECEEGGVGELHVESGFEGQKWSIKGCGKAVAKLAEQDVEYYEWVIG